MTNPTALAKIETITAIDLFTPEVIDPILTRIREESLAAAAKMDISSPGSRSDIASLAHKIARSKTFIDGQRKSLVSDEKKRLAKIDAEGKRIWENLEALQAEVRKPLTDWENAEKERVANHERNIKEIEDCGNLAMQTWNAYSAEAMRDRMNEIDADGLDWQEFKVRTAGVKAIALKQMADALAKREAYEAEQVELARLRQEAAEREQREREERIAREAKEQAERAAKEREERAAKETADREAKLERESQAREAEAKAAAELADRRAKQAEADRIAAEERHKREKKAAIEAERERVAEETRKAEAEAKAAAELADRRAKQAEADRIAAEERHKREKKAAIEAERERVAEETRKAEAEAKAAAELADRRAKQAEADRIAAEERHKREKKAAIEAERERVAEETRKAEAEAKAREKDKAHKAEVNSNALAALVEAGLSHEDAKKAITAIAKGLIPNVKVSY